MSQAFKKSDRFSMVHQIFESTKRPKMEESKWPMMSYQHCRILSWTFVESTLVFLLLRLTWLHFTVFFLVSLGGLVCCFLLRKAYIANIRREFLKALLLEVCFWLFLISSEGGKRFHFRLHFHACSGSSYSFRVWTNIHRLITMMRDQKLGPTSDRKSTSEA